MQMKGKTLFGEGVFKSLGHKKPPPKPVNTPA
jgi:hypothetical protein